MPGRQRLQRVESSVDPPWKEEELARRLCLGAGRRMKQDNSNKSLLVGPEGWRGLKAGGAAKGAACWH